MKLSTPAALLAALTLTLTGCSALPGGTDPNGTPSPTSSVTQPAEATSLDQAVTLTDDTITADGVLAEYTGKAGTRTTGYHPASDLYVNAFTYYQDGSDLTYQRILAADTDTTWAAVRTILTTGEGATTLYTAPGDQDGFSFLTTITDTDNGDHTFTRVLTWNGNAKNTTTITATTKAGLITDLTVKNSFSTKSTPLEACAYTARLDGCLTSVTFTYDPRTRTTLFEQALTSYKKQLPDAASLTAFDTLARIMNASAAKAESTGYITLNMATADTYSYDPATGTGRSNAIENGTIVSRVITVNDFDARIFRDTFLDGTDGGAMYTGGTITATGGTITVNGFDKTQGPVIFTVTGGVITKISDARYDKKNPDLWVITYKAPEPASGNVNLG